MTQISLATLSCSKLSIRPYERPLVVCFRSSVVYLYALSSETMSLQTVVMTASLESRAIQRPLSGCLPLATTDIMADLADELLRDLEGDDSGDDGGYVDEEQEYAQAQAQAQAKGNGGENGTVSRTQLGKRKASEGDEEGGGDDDDDDAMNGDEQMPRVKEEEQEVALPEGGIRPAEELDADDVAQMQLKDVKDVSSVARLAGSKHFREVIQVG